MLAVADLQRRVSLASVLLGAVALLCLCALFIAGLEAFVVSTAVAALCISGLRSLTFPLAFLVLTVPLQSEVALTIDNRSVTWTKIAVAGLLLAFAARFLAGNLEIEITGIALALGAVVLAMAASAYNANDVDAWAGEVYRWLVALLVYIAAVAATKDPLFAPTFVASTAVAVVGAAIAGVYQAFAHVGPETFQARGLTRAYSAFGEPNPFAGYLEMTVPLLFALTLAWLLPKRGGGAAKRPAAWFVALIVGGVAFGTVALVLSQSRGGLLGFAAGIATVLWLNGGWARSVVLATFVICAIALVLPFVGPRVRESLVAGVGNPTSTVQVTTENFAAQERIAHWRAGLVMWKDHPVLGAGAGNFSDQYRESTQVWRFRIPRGHAHNSYLQAAAQAGTIGFVAYGALVVTVIATLVRRLKLARPETRAMVAGALGVTVAVLFHGVFDYLHVLSLGLQLGVVWAGAEIVGRSYGPRWPRQEALACRP
jgi:O-antigen ligase